MLMRGFLPLVWLDLKRFWASPTRLLLSLAQPLLYLFVLGAGLAGGTYALDSHYQAYIYPGIVAMSLLFGAVSASVAVVHDRQVGFFKAVLVSPLPRSTLALAKIAAGALLALAQSLPLLPFAPLVGLGFTPALLGQMLLAMALLALAFSALGLAAALPFRSVLVFPVVSNALTLPMFFLSGALYPLDLAPAWLQTVAAGNPAAYGVDLLRGVVSGRFLFPPLLSCALLALFTLLPGAWVIHTLRGRGGRL